MDRETADRVKREGEMFFASINQDTICELASSASGGLQCRNFGKPMRGSYNICFPFELDGTAGIRRWIVRVPNLPAVAFPEEKMRGEVATIKYVLSSGPISLWANW
jgi:hypothetical protein